MRPRWDLERSCAVFIGSSRPLPPSQNTQLACESRRYVRRGLWNSGDSSNYCEAAGLQERRPTSTISWTSPAHGSYSSMYSSPPPPNTSAELQTSNLSWTAGSCFLLLTLEECFVEDIVFHHVRCSDKYSPCSSCPVLRPSGGVDMLPQWQEVPPRDSWEIPQASRLNKQNILQLFPLFNLCFDSQSTRFTSAVNTRPGSLMSL